MTSHDPAKDRAGPVRPTVLGVGEVLWDCFGSTRQPGGAPANVAFHANQLGCRGLILSRVGCDPAGDELCAYFAARNLETQYIQRDPNHPTGTVMVDATRADHPVYTIAENVAWDHLHDSASWKSCFASASAVCFGTLAQRSPASRSTIQQGLATAKQAWIVFDVNLRPPWYTPEVVQTSLRLAHVVKLSEEEVPMVCRLLELPSCEAPSLAHAIFDRFAVQTVFVTRAERGCLAVSRKDTVDIPGRPIQLADAVGAGDAFTAGMIHGLLHEWSLEATASFANAVGALVAEHHGAMPDLAEPLDRLVREMSPSHRP